MEPRERCKITKEENVHKYAEGKELHFISCCFLSLQHHKLAFPHFSTLNSSLHLIKVLIWGCFLANPPTKRRWGEGVQVAVFSSLHFVLPLWPLTIASIYGDVQLLGLSSPSQPWKSISRTTVLHSVSRAPLPLRALGLFDFFSLPCFVLERFTSRFLANLFWCISRAEFFTYYPDLPGEADAGLRGCSSFSFANESRSTGKKPKIRMNELDLCLFAALKQCQCLKMLLISTPTSRQTAGLVQSPLRPCFWKIKSLSGSNLRHPLIS